MKRIFSVLVFLLTMNAFSQAIDSLPVLDRTIKVTDPFYREDQFYLGVTHSILGNQPDQFKQRSISIGTNFGFLRDIPINKQRTIAIAPGFGFAFYNLRHNWALLNVQEPQFMFDADLNKNTQKLTYFEIPIEFRWRNSKVHSHKFWRVYTGVKYSYLLHSTTKYSGTFGDMNIKKNDLVSKSNIGMYVSAGFNTWNLYAYYGFQPLYKKGTHFDNNSLNMINVGLMFYIL